MGKALKYKLNKYKGNVTMLNVIYGWPITSNVPLY